ncbi:ABC transporter substrate-binding protein [Pontibacter rufus]|uniref:ABC transporter substrate-binding protein n=1 Tax=Pontibacter rufus TaxID=2791028 RepID=UPI001E40AD4E|nr:ABC transporter substrate-binding protein [Pontibacter sp. 172403-2]
MAIDLADDKIKPALAATKPSIVQQDSLTYITYQLRPEAQWTNGSPVTAADVAFTLKVLKAPLLNNERMKPQVAFIHDIIIDKADKRKFTFVCDGFTPEMELLTGDFFILPAYLFDPEGKMEAFTVSDFAGDNSARENDEGLQNFAAHYNSAEYARSKDLLQGSGGYVITAWEQGQYLTLKRKDDWWGNHVDDNTHALTANPLQISFKIIPDNTTALLALKNQQLDVLENIPAAEFNQLKADKSFTEDYALYTPNSYEFAYIGLNSRLPKLSDKRTRQAIANLLDINSFIKVSQQSYATPTVGPVPPSIKPYYNNKLKPYSYNLQKATALLQAAGWQRKADGWFKTINGQQQQLTLEVSYRAGNTVFENAALIFQQGAAKAGIPVTVQAQEGSLFSQKAKAHDFDMFFRALSGNPFVFNFKPLFYTSYANDGANYTGFGTPESDSILDAYNVAEDDKEKARLLKRLQEILHEEAAFIALYYQKDRLAVHRRFTNLKISGLEPNYDVSSFKLQE